MTEAPIYLDYAASAPVRPEARDAMLPFLDGRWGNPSSLHRWGREARAALEDARARLARVIGASPAEIVFTRAGTEADALAILGRARTVPGAPVAVTAIEHKAVLASAHAAADEGAPLILLPVDPNGVVEMAAVDAALERKPAVLSVMWANNEVGVMQPVREVAERCRAAGVVFHSDAVQALGKVPVRVDQVAADLLAFSAHKVGGPKGIGALYVRRGTRLKPLLFGGGQERGLRPGTEDVAGAVGFAAAAEAVEAAREGAMSRIGALRDRLEAGLLERVPGLVVNAAGAPRLPTVSNVSVPGADPEALLVSLDLQGIAVSSGSACSSGAVEPSHVLTAMGIPADLAGPSVRFSLGWGTTDEEIDRVLDIFTAVAERVRSLAG
ncbi:cysteine desulfurase family protein [Longimicrobium sp.]|uniref:cysteine desulfurase family protein n=1 Tax=Longimicrobium sp. TaxID=2029185 RepID=UPI002C7F31AF|nr:cysteine desulfurase family protein [Longimicrobium sp.]HSU17957.1 cysteine desulfurase family protein [Longimicrobium sp.]